MDGDGKPDVVAIDNYTGQMAVVLNDGEGGLGEAQTFTVAQGLDDLRVADLNGDGLPDVVVVNPTTQTISVFLSIKPLISSPIAVSVGANQQLVGSNVSITTKVASSGSVAPTGSITLLDGSAVLGKQTLDNTGLATFTMDTLAAGMHSLTTNYSGETMYASATSQAISVAITDFQVALSQPAEAVKAGATAAFTLALTPIAGLTGTVNISCSGLPSGTVCSTVSMDLNGQKTTTTVTVTTTAASSSVRHVRPDDRSLHYAGIFLGGLQG